MIFLLKASFKKACKDLPTAVYTCQSDKRDMLGFTLDRTLFVNKRFFETYSAKRWNMYNRYFLIITLMVWSDNKIGNTVIVWKAISSK